MKTKILLLCIILTLLAGCGPAPIPAPTARNAVDSSLLVTASPGATRTPVLPELTPTPTLSPTTTQTPTPTHTPQPTATPTPAEIISGVTIHSLSSRQQLKIAQDAGVRWTRYDDFHWADIEPVRSDPPTYQWNKVDEAGLVKLVESGLLPIGIVLFTPEWAQKFPGVACGPIAETALDAFIQFLGVLVSRYSQAPYNVHHWEIGNEPDIAVGLVAPDAGYGCWGDSSDPFYGGGYYARVLEKAYPAIKAADPQAQVLVGGLALSCDPIKPPETSPGSGQFADCSPSRFIEGVLAGGGGGYFDGVSFHAYDYYMGNGAYGHSGWHSHSTTTGPVATAKVSYLRGLLATYGVPGKQLYITEVSLLCGRDGTEAGCAEADFLNTKAAYGAQQNAAALASGVAANIWYSLTGWRASGWVTNALRPLDVHRAIRFSNEQLNGVVFTQKIAAYPGLIGYEFTRPDKRVWIIWSQDGLPHQLTVPEAPAAVLDVFGGPLEVNAVLQVGLQPIYIEWAPSP